MDYKPRLEARTLRNYLIGLAVSGERQENQQGHGALCGALRVFSLFPAGRRTIIPAMSTTRTWLLTGFALGAIAGAIQAPAGLPEGSVLIRALSSGIFAALLARGACWLYQRGAMTQGRR